MVCLFDWLNLSGLYMLCACTNKSGSWSGHGDPIVSVITERGGQREGSGRQRQREGRRRQSQLEWSGRQCKEAEGSVRGGGRISVSVRREDREGREWGGSVR